MPFLCAGDNTTENKPKTQEASPGEPISLYCSQWASPGRPQVWTLFPCEQWRDQAIYHDVHAVSPGAAPLLSVTLVDETCLRAVMSISLWPLSLRQLDDGDRPGKVSTRYRKQESDFLLRHNASHGVVFGFSVLLSWNRLRHVEFSFRAGHLGWTCYPLSFFHSKSSDLLPGHLLIERDIITGGTIHLVQKSSCCYTGMHYDNLMACTMIIWWEVENRLSLSWQTLCLLVLRGDLAVKCHY